MTVFRPCIDLHQGKVKQIVGGTLSDGEHSPTTNFISDKSSAYYAELYRRDRLYGGHVIMLGPGNEDAALLALQTYPGGLQIGGGITPDNATRYLDSGASHVIVTSYVFAADTFSLDRLLALKKVVGRERLVLDLSCRRIPQGWQVATNRWQTVTSLVVDANTLQSLAEHCAEFLVHAADVEGLQAGMDLALLELLGKHCPIPATYAGGARSVDDLRLCGELSQQRVDLTIGSALDIFGGKGASYEDCVRFNQRQSESRFA